MSDTQMEQQVKIQLAMMSINAIFNYGLPSFIKMMNSLNDKEKITLEDIENLTGPIKRQL
jgi:hypothetical protein